MKKIFFILTVATFAYACGNQDGAATGGADSSATASTHEEPAAADVTENPDYVKGLELIAQSDCLTCHKVDEKAIGPAYRDVANKYSNDNQ
ncbi:MAG TPA: cytochrome c class I, partial [Chitinophagaceae bacterium]|nr:cytochrome c class I [Chitinophagaceae bacterium]